jgi:hypothetical protein
LVTTAPSTTQGSQAIIPLPAGWTSEFSQEFNQWFFISPTAVAQWDDPRVRYFISLLLTVFRPLKLKLRLPVRLLCLLMELLPLLKPLHPSK